MSKRRLLLSLVVLSGVTACCFVLYYFRSPSAADTMPPNPETQTLLADYIKSEIARAKSQLNTNLWDAIMVGVSDQPASPSASAAKNGRPTLRAALSPNTSRYQQRFHL